MYLIFTLVFSWNELVYEIKVPIAYAHIEGSDEPVHPWKIATVVTDNCPHTQKGMLIKLHALI